uniref:uncharacterized protein LOC101297645 isoform X3 n=1 Tax=Fragaria vesca subsp. vesca TaxID=101020 RepID=UPI0005C88F05|nr:PREDICTED: uncharacterized protein LOC101297645 isoform X3 [Fragaria vesca subsp. vesca]
MAHEFEACAECTHRCQLAHGKKKSGSHIANSFFKIMIGKQFSKFMELPPKVARIVLLSDRKTFLEDLTRQRWNVAISTVNGSLAFQQGWNAFALDHDLQVGDFLVFNYVVGSHFTVKIYDNSGCELNLFETIHQHNINRDQCHTFVKSTASKSGLVTFAGPDAEISKCLNELNGMNKPLIITEYASTHDDDNERSKGKRKAEFAEDMSCMMKRDYGNQPEENRAHILDLSSVESFKKIRTCGSDGTKVSVVNETHSYCADLSLKLRSEADSVKIPVAKEVPNRVIPLDAAELERTEKNNYSESKVKGASLSDKDSSTNVTSGHLFPTLPDNNQQNDIFSGTLIIAAQKCHSANASGNDHQVAVSGQENDLMDDTCQSANKNITISGISKSCGIPITSASQNDTAMEVIEIEPLELTSHPCSKEVIPESNDDAMIITEKEFKEFSSDPCSQEVIPERKDETTRAIENVIVDLTSDECRKQVIEKEESPDVSAKVDNQSSNSQRRDIPSDQAEFERTEEHNKSEAKVNKVPSDKDSCTETSGHPFPTHSQTPEENGETITDTSKPTSDNSKKPTKECQNADGSELLLSNDQVTLVQMEPNLMDDSVPRDNKELTGISESIHDPITFESQNLYDTIINEKESLEATCQEAIPQRKDTIIIESETVEVTLEPCSQEVIPEIKETIIIEDGSAEVTLDPSCQETIPERERESLMSFNRSYRKRADTKIRTASSDASDLERTEESNYSDVKVRKVSTSDEVPHTNQTSCHLNPICPVNVEEDTTSIAKISNEGLNKLKTADRSGNVQVAVSQKENVVIDDSCQQKRFTGVSKVFEVPVPFGSQDYSAQPSKISNKLQSQSNFARENETTLPVVKSEPVEDAVATFPSFTISCLATDRQSYLELPKSLPVSLKATNGRSKMDRRVVYLQGPDNRLWPVLYIQKFFFRTLANGWEAFSMANNIEKGDRCTIAVIDQTKGICSVNVVKMRDDMEFYEEWEQQPLINLS